MRNANKRKDFLLKSYVGDRCKKYIDAYMNKNVTTKVSTNVSAIGSSEQPQTDRYEGPERWELLAEKFWERFTTVKSNHTNCEKGWSAVNLSMGELCYFFNFTLASRDEAVEGCRRMSSILPLPASPSDDQVIRALSGRINGMGQVGTTYGVWIDAIFKETGCYSNLKKIYFFFVNIDYKS